MPATRPTHNTGPSNVATKKARRRTRVMYSRRTTVLQM